MLSIHCRANRPHLGLCPENPCSSPVAPGISGFAFKVHRESQASSEVEANISTLLSSWDGYLLGPVDCPKGSQASCGVLREDSGLLSRPCRKRRASSRDDGRILWFFSSCGVTCGVFLELRQGNTGCLSCWPREVQSPFEVRRGAEDGSRVTTEQIEHTQACVQELRVPLQW